MVGNKQYDNGDLSMSDYTIRLSSVVNSFDVLCDALIYLIHFRSAKGRNTHCTSYIGNTYSTIPYINILYYVFTFTVHMVKVNFAVVG